MMNAAATDWDAYYSRPALLSGFTRAISGRRIQRTLAPYMQAADIDICELGGANSCFAASFLARPAVRRYHVIDSNARGMRMLEKRFDADGRVSTQWGDIRDLGSSGDKFDIVFSVGLIEHFPPDETARCIAAHFGLCRPGGVVLMTFPTPTLLYRGIRGLAEAARSWSFPDERPLEFAEVVGECNRYGRLEHCSVNWAIGLTQGYVLAICSKEG